METAFTIAIVICVFLILSLIIWVTNEVSEEKERKRQSQRDQIRSISKAAAQCNHKLGELAKINQSFVKQVGDDINKIQKKMQLLEKHLGLQYTDILTCTDEKEVMKHGYEKTTKKDEKETKHGK